MSKTIFTRTLGALALGATLGFGASSAFATPIGPNLCLTGSTSANCIVALDEINSPGTSYTNTNPALGYVTGAIQTSSNGLIVSFTGGTDGVANYRFSSLAFLLGTAPQTDLALSPSNVEVISATNGSGAVSISSGFSISTDAGSWNGSTFSSGIQMDGWGDFNVKIAYNENGAQGGIPGGFNNALTSLTLRFLPGLDTTGLNLLTSQLLVLNGKSSKGQDDGGQSAAGHVYSSTGWTGFAAWPNNCDQNEACGDISVPAPASLPLIGFGLIVLGLVHRHYLARR